MGICNYYVYINYTREKKNENEFFHKLVINQSSLLIISNLTVVIHESPSPYTYVSKYIVANLIDFVSNNSSLFFPLME